MTEEINKQKELNESKQRFDIATLAGGIGVWDRDMVNDRLVWDDRMFELYGIERAQFKGTYETWAACVHPEDRAAAEQAVNEAELGKKEFDTEFRIIRPDGKIRFIRAFGKVIRDKNGTPTRMIGTNQDITEQVETEQRFTMLFETMHSGVAIYRPVENNRDFVFVDMNPAGLKSEDVTREQIIGKKLTDCFPGVKESGVFDALQRVATTGKTELVPLVQYQDARIEQWVENHIFRLPTGLVVAVFEDITEKQKAEEELRHHRDNREQRVDDAYRRVADHCQCHGRTRSPHGRTQRGNRRTEETARQPGGETGRRKFKSIVSKGGNHAYTDIRSGKTQPRLWGYHL